MTPGMKTSEFLMALMPMVVGLVLIIFGVLKNTPALVELGTLMLTGSSAGYGLSRGLAKLRATPEPTPAPTTPTGAAGTIAGIR